MHRAIHKEHQFKIEEHKVSIIYALYTLLRTEVRHINHYTYCSSQTSNPPLSPGDYLMILILKKLFFISDFQQIQLVSIH